MTNMNYHVFKQTNNYYEKKSDYPTVPPKILQIGGKRKRQEGKI